MDRQAEGYESPFSTRYGGKAMQALFSRAHRARLFRRLWVMLAESQMELGLPINPEQIAEMEAQADNIDFDEINRLEGELRHDVMAHLRAFALVCPHAAPIIHLGATSMDALDNVDALRLRARGVLPCQGLGRDVRPIAGRRR